MDPKLASTVIAEALEATSLQELADGALSRLARSLGASHAVVYQHGSDGLVGATPRDFPAALMSDYCERFLAECPYQEAKQRLNPEVAVVSDLIVGAVQARSRVIQDFYRPARIERQLVMRLSQAAYGEPGCHGVVFCRAQRDAPFSARAQEQLRVLRPALVGVAERNLRWREALAERDLLAAALGGGAATLLLDAAGRLLWMSRGATALLGNDGAPGQFLERLRAQAECLCQPERLGEPGRGPAVELFEERDGKLLCAALVPVRTSAGALQVVARLHSRRDPRELVPANFGLSAAEQAVASLLLAGGRNREIARQLFVSEETVRSHLKHLYRKLRVHSRVEAVLKLRGSSNSDA